MRKFYYIIPILFLLSCQTKKNIEEVVVIGGGLMGSSAAWELSQDNANVLLLEQQDSIYTFGSSFGEARISRSLGPKDDIFSFLQQRSVQETKDLIAFLNSDLEESQYQMEDIYSTSPVTYFYDQSQATEVEALLNGQMDTIEFAPNPAKALDLFGMTIPDSSLVIREYKQYSGTLNPKILISKLHQGIRKSGNRIRYNQKVTGLRRAKDLFEIDMLNTKSGTTEKIYSKQVVVAAGPFNGLLVKELTPYFEQLITPKRLFLAFLKIKTEAYSKLTNEQQIRLRQYYPVAYLDSEIFYSMIEKEDDQGMPMLKVGGHFLRTAIDDLTTVWEKELTDEEITWSIDKTANYLNTLNLPLTKTDLVYDRGYSCVYSLTQSEVPYVSYGLNKLAVDSNFVLVGGMSGIGAKGSLAYGRIAADLLLNKKDTSFMIQKTKQALGIDRLMKDIERLEE